MKPRIIFIFISSLLLLLSALFIFNQINKNRLKKKVNDLTMAEGRTIHDFVNEVGSQLHYKPHGDLIMFLEKLFENPEIVYIGLMKGEQLDFLLSRYEGYFPVTPDQDFVVILESPLGKILNIRGDFSDREGILNQLYIGFNYQFLTHFEQTALRNFLVISVIFIILFILFTATVIFLNHRYIQKQTELELEKQQKQHFKDLSLLTAQISHEIKNPLNSLYLSFQALEKYFKSNQDADFYKDSIKGEIKRINYIIKSYSSYSKQSELRLKTLELEHFFNDLKLLFSEELRVNQANLIIETSSIQRIVSDSQILKQIFINLISNAMQAKARRIEIRAAVHSKMIKFQVTDNGVGFDEAIKEKVFSPFATSKRSGMGLGLYIVHKLVTSLNGNIELVSTHPGQTRFEISFLVGEKNAQ